MTQPVLVLRSLTGFYHSVSLLGIRTKFYERNVNGKDGSHHFWLKHCPASFTSTLFLSHFS